MEFVTNSEAETFELAEKLAGLSKPGEIYCLNGDLGAGKTVFAKGFAKGLGINETVSSPTFNIVKEYHSGRLSLYHFDVYRVEDPDELYEIGFDEYFYGDGVCLVEWAGLIKELVPKNAVWVRIERAKIDQYSLDNKPNTNTMDNYDKRIIYIEGKKL